MTRRPRQVESKSTSIRCWSLATWARARPALSRDMSTSSSPHTIEQLYPPFPLCLVVPYLPHLFLSSLIAMVLPLCKSHPFPMFLSLSSLNPRVWYDYYSLTTLVRLEWTLLWRCWTGTIIRPSVCSCGTLQVSGVLGGVTIHMLVSVSRPVSHVMHVGGVKLVLG